MNPNIHVVFFSVKTAQDKLLKISSLAEDFFKKKEKLLYITSDLKSAQFVDNLLWTFDEKSFIPHSLSNDHSEELIVITSSMLNINKSHDVFNLSTNYLSIVDGVKRIYEFEDIFKKEISQAKFSFYKENGYLVESV